MAILNCSSKMVTWKTKSEGTFSTFWNRGGTMGSFGIRENHGEACGGNQRD